MFCVLRLPYFNKLVFLQDKVAFDGLEILLTNMFDNIARLVFYCLV